MPTPPKTNRKIGPPTKKNEAVITRLIATARLGLPYAIVAQRAGITRETLTQWRHLDPELDRRLDEARAEAAEEAWKKIMAHGESDSPNAWQSIAWRLERSHPESFARPEIQLAAVQSNFTTNNTLSISFEMAKNLESRAAPMRRKIEQLFAQHSGGREAMPRQLEAPQNGDLPAAEMKLPPLTIPAGKLTPAWWGQLSRGDNTREVERETAVRICRMIAEDVLGKQRAQTIEVKFDPDWPILLRDLHGKLESLCGARGWDALTRRGKAKK
jgi:hypothetical protein